MIDGKAYDTVRELAIALDCFLSGTARQSEEVERLKREVEAWKETASRHLRNEEYYRGLVQKCGEPFGDAAKTQDDGNVQEDILCAKVPELVASAAEKAWRYDDLQQ